VHNIRVNPILTVGVWGVKGVKRERDFNTRLKEQLQQQKNGQHADTCSNVYVMHTQN
jgi:hypothetical protein